MPKRFFTLLLTATLFSASAQNPYKDSLATVISGLKKQAASVARDTSLNKSINLYAREYAYSDPDSAIYFTQQALEYAKSANWEIGKGISYHQMGMFASNKGDYPAGLKYLEQALNVWNKNEQSADPYLKSHALTRKPRTLSAFGIIYDNMSKYPQALDYYLKALRYHEMNKDKSGQATTIGNIGLVYSNQREFKKALEFYNKALAIDTELKDYNGVARHLGNMAIVFQDQNQNKEALDYYLKALKLKEEYSNPVDIAYTLGNICNVHASFGDAEAAGPKQEAFYTKAIEYGKRALAILEEQNETNGIARNLGNIGTVYSKQKKNAEAEKYLLRALKICDSIGMLNEKMIFEGVLSTTYEQKGDFKNALEHQRVYGLTRDSIFNLEKNKELTAKQLNYEFERKEAEQALKTKAEKEKIEAVAAEAHKKQLVISFSIAGILLIVLIFSVSLYSRFKLTQKQKAIIEAQKLEVTIQKDMVDEKQKEIIDSINYARRIQRALITNENYIHKHLTRLQKG